MHGPWASLRRRVLRLDRATAHAMLRGVLASPSPRVETLERIVDAVVDGYQAALDDEGADPLAERLDLQDARWRGFAYEGAGMALWLLDSLSLPRGSRWRSFVAGRGAPHAYLLHVGAGLAIARMGQDWERRTAKLDPLLRWLALDGAGFHAGAFEPQRYHRDHTLPGRLGAREGRVFDQGLGRSTWFVEGADVERIAASLPRFAPERRADLWSGAGLACAYAGGVTLEQALWLFEQSGPHRAEFAQGVAFAVAARVRGGNPSAHTGATCRSVWRREAEEVAALVRRIESAPPASPGESAYEAWRRAIREAFEPAEVAHAGGH